MDELPRKLKKKEAKKTPQIMKWFEKNYPFDCVVEVKVGKNKVKEHQEAALEQVAHGTFAYKIPDMGRRNPFDFIILRLHIVHAVVATYKDGLLYCEVKNIGEKFVVDLSTGVVREDLA